MHPNSLANLIPAKPGHALNPNGRKALGAYIKEYMNSMAKACAEGGMGEDELRKIHKDKKENWNKRVAALRMLRALENPDIADFEPVLDGQQSLREIRGAGVDTATIKKIKCKKTTRKIEGTDEFEEEVTREIELHDRSGLDFDRIMDRTEGKPTQPLAGPDGAGIPIDITVKVIRGASMDDI